MNRKTMRTVKHRGFTLLDVPLKLGDNLIGFRNLYGTDKNIFHIFGSWVRRYMGSPSI